LISLRRLVVQVSGPVANIEAAFHVNMQVYQQSDLPRRERRDLVRALTGSGGAAHGSL
jgi:hypothetical protein